MRTNDKIRIAVLVALSSGRAVAGDVVFDGTTGAAGNALFDSATNTFSIREQDGTLADRNLFHSFSTFNIDVAETAEFTATSAVDNVISRVTSLQPTTIDGTVRSLIPNANFWFVNPAGITVGATGVIDVQGAIALGSADFVEFQNGLQWRALNNGGSAASALLVNPTDFGFLPGSTADALSVTNQNFAATAAGEPQANGRSFLLTGGAGVEVVSSGSLFLEDGKIETARGGNVLIAGAGIELRNTQIYAPRGRVGIASVADPSTLVLDDNAEFVFADVPRESLRPIHFNYNPDANPGDPIPFVHPFSGNVINTSSDSFVGGGVYLLGGEIKLRSTLINSESLQGSPADVAARGVHVVAESLDMNRNTSLTSVVRGHDDFFRADDDGVPADGPAAGDSGPINITLYGDLTVSGTEDQVFADGRDFRTSISTRTYSSGDGGNIAINAANATIEGPSTLAGPAPTEAQLALGGPAAAFISSDNDALDRNDESSRAAATGNAGDIDITLSGTLRLRGLRWSEQQDERDPDRPAVLAGAIIASGTQHTGDLDDGQGNALGTAGEITIKASSLELEDAGQISSVTTGTTSSGDIEITLTGGHLSISTEPNVTFTSGIFTRARSDVDNPLFGSAGDITIDVTATDPAEGWISVIGTGQGGLGSRLLSDAVLSEGIAGDIGVHATGAIVFSGAELRTEIKNNNDIPLDPDDPDAETADIRIESDSTVTLDGSKLIARSEDGRASGSITVEASGVLITGNSEINANFRDNSGGAQGFGPGTITIRATGDGSGELTPHLALGEATPGVVRIVDSSVTANNIGGSDDNNALTRGNVVIGARSVADPDDSNAQLTDHVVIVGSTVSTDVDANGVGDDISIRGNQGVWILGSNGNGQLPPVGDPAARRSRISAITNNSATEGGKVEISSGAAGITIEGTDIDTSNAIAFLNAGAPDVASNIAILSPGDVHLRDVVITTETTGIATAGDIQIEGDSVGIVDSTLSSDASLGDTQFDDSGEFVERIAAAGAITVTSNDGNVFVERSILASSAGLDAGQAGIVSFDSARSISMSGTDINTSVRTGRTTGAGDADLLAAQIKLDADVDVNLADTKLESQTFGALDAGAISVTAAAVTISGGEITAATVVDADTIVNTGDAGTVTLTAGGGAARLVDAALVSTSSEGPDGGQAGIISITGNGVELQDATITTAVASTLGGLTAAEIRLDASTSVLSLTGSTLTAATSGAADAGDINLDGASISMSGGTISASTTSTGDAGDVAIIADTVELTDGAFVETSALDEATSSTNLGDAGTIEVRGVNVTLADAALSTTTDSDILSDQPAFIHIRATGALSLTNSSLSSATTGAMSAGEVILDGDSTRVSGGTITASTTSTGHAGRVAIAAGELGGDIELIDGAEVFSSSTGADSGQAGTIEINGGNITLAGANLRTSTESDVVATPAQIQISGIGALTLTDTSISAETSGAISAGSISLGGQSIAMTGGSLSTSAVGTNAADTNLGAAGKIQLVASNITLTGADLSTSTDSDVIAATPAEIFLNASSALALNDADLTAGTTGAASAGAIALNGASISMSGGTITASTTSTGNAGFVTIVAGTGGDVQLSGGAVVETSALDEDTSSTNLGNAGRIEVSGANVTLADTTLSTETDSDTSSSPAVIILDASGVLSLTDSDLTSATTGAASAGAITLDGASINVSDGAITASTTSTGAAGHISIKAAEGGDVELIDGAAVVSSSTGAASGAAGRIEVTGADVTLADSSLSTSTGSDITTVTPAEIAIEATGALSLTRTDLSAATSGAADAGNITLTGASIAKGGGSITASTTAAGDAGEVRLTATNAVDVTSGAAIETSSQGADSGKAGIITISGSSLRLADAEVATTTGSNITTQAPARIDLTTAGALSLTNTDVSAETSGAVAAGNITLAGSSINLSGGTVSAATTAAGNAGNIALNAANAVAVTSGATIKSSSEGLDSGAAGTIAVTGSSITLADAEVTTSIASNNSALNPAQIDLTTPGVLSLTRTTVSAATSADASAGSINLTGASISMNGGTVTARTTGAGDAGLVKVGATSGDVQVAGGATIETSSQGIDSGAAGTIDIRGSQVSLANTDVKTSVESNVAGLSPAAITIAATGALSLTDGTDVDATTSGAAPGGSIVLTGDAILVDTSSVSSQTSGVGDAGSVCLAAGSTACAPQLSGRAQILAADVPGSGGITLASAELSTSTSGSGSAGNVDVHASGTLLLSSATLQSSSSATSEAGDGGSINLSSGFSDLLLIENSTVQTNAEAAEGGDITLDGGGSSIYVNNSVLFASAGANGNGGDVTISNINQTLIEHSLILAQAVQGNGGSILLTLQDGATFLQDSSTLINADSQQGINGEVTINRPNTDLNSSIQPQEVDVSKPAELGNDVCAPATPGARSTFIREGRGGVAESPDGYMTTMPSSEAAPERTSASDKAVPVARTAAHSPEEPGTETLTRGCL